MKYIIFLSLLFSVGCYKSMTNDEIIIEIEKCKSHNLKYNIVVNGINGTDPISVFCY